MKNKKSVFWLSAILALLFTVMGIIYITSLPEPDKGKKQINVTVIFADKTKKAYKIYTDAEFLADALLEKEIITEKSKDGMYTVIAGERADYNLDMSWWCLSQNGEMTNYGINDQPITDGDSFEITNTPS